MATTATTRAMPAPRGASSRGTSSRGASPKEHTFTWEGRDRAGKVIRGEMRAGRPASVQTSQRRLLLQTRTVC